jgi:lipopolysaccharide transport system ATP-binding protein
MSDVSKSGRTVLFVSHNMAAVENLCQRGVVLERGRLVFDGTAKDAVQHYLSGISSAAGRSGRTGHVVELEGVGERRSPVAPLLRRLEFFTENEQPLTEGLPIGARLKVKVHFDLPKPTASFNVGLGFNNSYGQRIFMAHSVFEPNRSDEEHVGAQVFSCEIPSFTLMPGEYAVKVWLELKRAQADAIEDAAKITVLESDFYGTGKVPWNGSVVLTHRWYLEPAANGR